jgi:hypothetical protein
VSRHTGTRRSRVTRDIEKVDVDVDVFSGDDAARAGERGEKQQTNARNARRMDADAAD